MIKILPASEALRLPSAQLTEDEKKIVDKVLADIDAEIHKHFKRNGFEYSTNCNNPAVVFEIAQLLQDAGYMVQCQPRLSQNRFNPQGPPNIDGFVLLCAPSREAVLATRESLLSLQ